MVHTGRRRQSHPRPPDPLQRRPYSRPDGTLGFEVAWEAKASTWIYRVALYAASAWTRRERRQPPTEPLAVIEQTLSVMEQPSDPRVDWLYEQIAQFEPIDRSVCLLMFDGFSYKEMAEMLGISESNVGVKIHRIKQRLVGKSRQEVQHEF